jgi:hypothetical protein
MRQIRWLPAMLPAFLWLSIVPVFQSDAEEIYRWKDASGTLCFSNVSPPGGVFDFSTLSAGSQGGGPGGATGNPGDTGEGGKEKPVEEASEVARESMPGILQTRIQSLETTIEHLETQFIRRPGDADLRRHLFEKKQQLHEDRIRLELISD